MDATLENSDAMWGGNIGGRALIRLLSEDLTRGRTLVKLVSGELEVIGFVRGFCDYEAERAEYGSDVLQISSENPGDGWTDFWKWYALDDFREVFVLKTPPEPEKQKTEA